jgi:hypothetical protein
MLNVVLIIVGIFVAVLLIVLFIDAFGMEGEIGEKIKPIKFLLVTSSHTLE